MMLDQWRKPTDALPAHDLSACPDNPDPGDMLPSERVLVYLADGSLAVAVYDHNHDWREHDPPPSDRWYWYDDAETIEMPENVVAWHPLPADLPTHLLPEGEDQ